MRHWLTPVLSILLAGVFANPAHAQIRDYIDVDPQDVLEQPKLYWSRGISFKDRLASPASEKTTKVADSKYHACELETAGEVFLSPDLAKVFGEHRVGEEFLFRGTVLTRKTVGLLGRRTRYEVVLTKAEPTAIENPAEIGRFLAELWGGGAETAVSPDLMRIKDMADRAQLDLLEMARENEMEPSEVFSPGSPARERMRSLCRRSIRRVEEQFETTANEILAGVILSILEAKYPEASDPMPSEEAPGVDPELLLLETGPDASPPAAADVEPMLDSEPAPAAPGTSEQADLPATPGEAEPALEMIESEGSSADDS